MLTRAFAAVGLLAVTVAALAGVYAMAVVRRGFSAREEPSGLEARLARFMRSASMPPATRSLQAPSPVTSEGLSEAKAHWADHCAGCHANNGSGATTLGRNMFPPAPDMRLDRTQKLSDGELYSIIQNGIRLTGMPAWGKPGNDDLETWALVAFIRRLPSLTSEEEREMRELNPKSAHEMKEQEQEDAFLGEGHDI